MKKISRKQRDRDILRELKNRIVHRKKDAKKTAYKEKKGWKGVNHWIEEESRKGLLVSNDTRVRDKTLHLPSRMDFSDNYDSTVQVLTAIRKLVLNTSKDVSGFLPKEAFRLVSINFDMLERISTPASLVLTAEISKWDDAIRRKLKPDIAKWNKKIYRQFRELGFFDLFDKKPDGYFDCTDNINDNSEHFVRYIKGSCGDQGKTRELKNQISEAVGGEVRKWTFLHGGLSEAITNVSHHAYPDGHSAYLDAKSWFMTGSYNSEEKELNVAFYDMGVGIPNSLPTSELKEKILEYVAELSGNKKSLHHHIIKGAVEAGRTRTKESDRGKGLQDMIEFIRQTKQGKLAIISSWGMYSFKINGNRPSEDSEPLTRPLNGTLIAWKVKL